MFKIYKNMQPKNCSSYYYSDKQSIWTKEKNTQSIEILASVITNTILRKKYLTCLIKYCFYV